MSIAYRGGVSGPAPTVSVCIPTFNRPAQLAKALAAVLAQDPPAGGFEVVVADDGSPDEDAVAEVVRKCSANTGTPVRLVRLRPNRGPAAARNAAWRAAAATWIAFTDDDCAPEPGWLRGLLAVADAERVAAVQGRTIPDPELAHLLGRPFVRSLTVDSPSRFYATCNMLYRRQLLDRLGGFDESFRMALGEDTDLGWRAEADGERIAFAPEAVVRHDVVVGTWRSELRSRRRWGDVVRVVRMHPGVRGIIWRPYLHRPSHVVPLILLGLLPTLLLRPLRGVWPTAVAAVVARDLLRDGAGRPTDRVMARLVDSYETLVVLRANLRERTLLL